MISGTLYKEGKCLKHQMMRDHYVLVSLNFFNNICLATVVFKFSKIYQNGEFERLIAKQTLKAKKKESMQNTPSITTK